MNKNPVHARQYLSYSGNVILREWYTYNYKNQTKKYSEKKYNKVNQIFTSNSY